MRSLGASGVSAILSPFSTDRDLLLVISFTRNLPVILTRDRL